MFSGRAATIRGGGCQGIGGRWTWGPAAATPENMIRSENPAVESGAEARPVDGSDRLVLLDALRGFALCGVFVSNVFMWFSGRVFLPRPQVEAMMANASFVDTAALHVFMTLIFGKFITIFSFMFGLGFAVQMGRAEARGTSIGPIYARRLMVMFGLGATHLLLLWYGDILHVYALLGFGLLLFRGRADKTLLWWAAGLIVLGPILGTVVLKLPQLLSSPEVAAAMGKEAAARGAAIRAETLQALSNGGYLDVLRAHANFFFGDFLKPMVAVIWGLFGRFVLGLLVGRRRYFQDAARYVPGFRRVFGWGLVAGVLGGGTMVVVQQLFMRKILVPDTLPWLPYAMPLVRTSAEVGFASVYVSGFVLLFQRASWQRLLATLAPVGRMALSNYLSQTVISLLIFCGYGFGQVGKLGPAQCMALALGIFCFQIGLSHLWLARFRFGPAEWVWRSLTYGKAQPMRLEAPAPTVAQSAPAA